MAKECFNLTDDQVTKDTRYAAKSGFVFASFYGDYHKQIASNLWDMMSKDKLVTKDNTTLKDHLETKGIDELGDCDSDDDPKEGTYVHHIKQVEDRFWNERFPVYNEWREKWWESYLKTGFFRMKTGFLCTGLYKRNQVINSPVQGSAFHCLLWSLIQIYRKLRTYRFESLVIGQIHDSIIMDIKEDELDQVLELSLGVMCNELREHWPWIITPVSVEVATSRTNWHEKKEIEF